MESEPESVNMPKLPGLENYEAPVKISILFKLFKRAVLRGNRELSLLCMFNIGKWIFAFDLTRKESMLTIHYYTISKRMYLIFESDEEQIMRSKSMTPKDFRYITKRELNNLIDRF